MEIICPECHFSRQVDESKIPARSQVATCPKCQTKFRFRELPEEFAYEPETPVAEEPARPSPAEEPRITQTQAPLEPVQEEAPEEMTEETIPSQESSPSVESMQQQEPKSAFPDIPAQKEEVKEELWERLRRMAPPETREDFEPPTSAGNKQIQTPEEETPFEEKHTQEEEQQPVPGWTGEFSSDFPDPMQEELAAEKEEASGPNVPPPFEQLDRYGFFPGLLMTIKLILTSPRLFFSVMPVGGGLSKPLTFAILVAMVQAFAQLAWGVVGLSIGVDIVNQEVTAIPYDLTSGVFNLLFTPAFIAVTLFVFTGFYHLIISFLTNSGKGFEGSFRALAYSYAPILSGIIPMPTIEITFIWMLAYAAWSLCLTAIALKHIHKTSYIKVIPVLLLPLLLGMIAAIALSQLSVPTI